MQPNVETFFDSKTFTFTHLVWCPQSKHAAIIDPVLDFDSASMSTSTENMQPLLDKIAAESLSVEWILETHAHADHLSGAQWLKTKLNAPIIIGDHIERVQATFNDLFELEGESAGNARDFDRLVADKETLPLGKLTITVIHTPGHTPSCCTYVIGDAAFVGDTLFMPDFGSARCDFPGGNARQLYQSIQKILALPDNTRLFMCHDYMPGGRELQWQTSVAEQKQHNIHVGQGVSEEEYVTMRTTRDAELAVPKLILPSLQVNIRAGKLPAPSKSGTSFIRLPLNKL